MLKFEIKLLTLLALHFSIHYFQETLKSRFHIKYNKADPIVELYHCMTQLMS